MSTIARLLALSVPLSLAVWQESPVHQHGSPYAHQGDSGIAALSPQELADLESGAGMGLARAAELNHFPGPRHVLELAADLGLSDEQRRLVTEIRARMAEAARLLGAEIIELERTLDRRFAHGHIDEEALRAATAAIAERYGELRYVHLRAHLETRALLEIDQVEAYDRLRGYGEGTAEP